MAPRADRRLAAILAVDVVGYSRLVGADETDTLARVKRHRIEFAEPLIAEHRGRVVKAHRRRRAGGIRERGRRG